MPISKRKNKMGLDNKEQKVMDAISECFNLFLVLDIEHQDEEHEFIGGIHWLQSIIAMRVVRRSYPKGWFTYLVNRSRYF